MDARGRWAGSGAMALTGDPRSAPLVAPDGVVERIEALAAPLGIDPLPLLGERAAITGLGRRGATSCGGGTRLLPASDGWLAVSLARSDDIDLLPAWLELHERAALDPWPFVVAELATRSTGDVVDRARLLGLPVAAVGEVAAPDGGPVVPTRVGDAPPDGGEGELLVVDLSSLWAGPLCAQLLGERGARVVKVESRDRPDGARRGPPAFFDLLHAGHAAVAFDFHSRADLDQLRWLLVAADVVIEGSRPRALEQLGIDARSILVSGPRVWVSITGYGRRGPSRDWVAFGDDAAAAGGLVAWGADGRPRFAADAVADPLSGIAAAAAAVDALAAGGRWLLDVSLARVAAFVVGQDRDAVWASGEPDEAAPPTARAASGRAPALGEHTDEVVRLA